MTPKTGRVAIAHAATAWSDIIASVGSKKSNLVAERREKRDAKRENRDERRHQRKKGSRKETTIKKLTGIRNFDRGVRTDGKGVHNKRYKLVSRHNT